MNQCCELGQPDRREINRTQPHEFPQVLIQWLQVVFFPEMIVFLFQLRCVFVPSFPRQEAGLAKQQSFKLKQVVIMPEKRIQRQ